MRVLTFFIVVIVCATVVFGQATISEITTVTTGPVTVSAQQVISDSTVGSIKARGKVTADIHRGRFKLEANEMEIEIDRNAGMITVISRGDVRSDMILQDGSTRTMSTNESKLVVKLTL